MAKAELKVLSAGAPKTAVMRCAQAFSAKTGVAVAVEFATAPVLREVIGSGKADVHIVVAPLGAANDFEAAGHIVAGSGSVIGSVKAAVTIRNGAHEPDLSSAATLKQAMLDAESLVYNEASSGQYIASMIDKLGLTEQLAAKTTRTKTGSGVMEHLHASKVTKEIGFGQATEIQVQVDKGLNVRLLGPLPKELENVTTYRSALLSAAAENQAAADLLAFMASAPGRQICQDTGLD